MDPQEARPPQGWIDRFRESWFPPAAVVAAFATFTAAAFRSRPAPAPAPSPPPGGPRPAAPPAVTPAPAPDLPRRYAQSALIGGSTSSQPFHRSLDGIAIGPGDTVYALGDDEVRVVAPDGEVIRRFSVTRGVCLTTGPDGRVYVGSLGRVDVYDDRGRLTDGFDAGDPGKPAAITALKLFRDEILVADAAARFIRRVDAAGRQVGTIGNQDKTRGFILPNHWLDFDVDAAGVVRATDSGRHRVAAWTIDGSRLGHFGRFGQRNPEDFVGCCNPVNLALTPDGKVVTAEKMVARVKVYETDGTLLAVIGPEHFDQSCTNLHIAVDSRERLLVGDPARREVKVFAWS